MDTKTLLTTLATASLLAGAADADVVAQYTFTGDSLSSTDASTSWETTALSTGAGLGAGTFDTFPGSSGSPSLKYTYGDVEADLTGALAEDDYLTFTVTPDAGFSIDYTNITFEMSKGPSSPTNKPGKGPSLHVFANNFAIGDVIGSGKVPDSKPDTDVWFSFDIDLSSLGTVTTPTVFRLYLDDGGALNVGHQIRTDTIVVNGDVVPEPGSLSLALLGLGGLLMPRRRRG